MEDLANISKNVFLNALGRIVEYSFRINIGRFHVFTAGLFMDAFYLSLIIATGMGINALRGNEFGIIPFFYPVIIFALGLYHQKRLRNLVGGIYVPSSYRGDSRLEVLENATYHDHPRLGIRALTRPFSRSAPFVRIIIEPLITFIVGFFVLVLLDVFVGLLIMSGAIASGAREKAEFDLRKQLFARKVGGEGRVRDMQAAVEAGSYDEWMAQETQNWRKPHKKRDGGSASLPDEPVTPTVPQEQQEDFEEDRKDTQSSEEEASQSSNWQKLRELKKKQRLEQEEKEADK